MVTMLNTLPTSALKDADDSSIWQHALAHQAVLVTKDEDFPHRLRQVSADPVIVWLRIGNTSRKALLLWFQPLLPQIIDLIEKGEPLIEVR